MSFCLTRDTVSPGLSLSDSSVTSRPFFTSAGAETKFAIPKSERSRPSSLGLKHIKPSSDTEATTWCKENKTVGLTKFVQCKVWQSPLICYITSHLGGQVLLILNRCYFRPQAFPLLIVCSGLSSWIVMMIILVLLSRGEPVNTKRTNPVHAMQKSGKPSQTSISPFSWQGTYVVMKQLRKQVLYFTLLWLRLLHEPCCFPSTVHSDVASDDSLTPPDDGRPSNKYCNWR